MNDLQVFTSPEFGQLRTLVIDDSPWAFGKDVATALGYAKPQNAVSVHVDNDDKTTASIQGIGSNYKTRAVIINESGLHSLILSSKLPSAKRFKRWVTSEVLPAIRRTGAYSVSDAARETQRTFTADDYLKAATIISSCRNERLPYVLGFLRQGGFTIPEVQKINTVKDDSGECARVINAAVNEHGLSLRAIGRLTGLQATQIQRIRTGASVPTIQRLRIICDAIMQELSQNE